MRAGSTNRFGRAQESHCDAERRMPEDPASPLQPEGPPAPKEDLLAQIWSLSSTLTEEAMAAATRKAQELQLDQNRGVVSLQRAS